MPIFRVKSVKIYTGQKNLHWRRQWRQWQLSGMQIWPTYYLEEIKRASNSQVYVLEPGKNRIFYTEYISARGYHVHTNLYGVNISRG